MSPLPDLGTALENLGGKMARNCGDSLRTRYQTARKMDSFLCRLTNDFNGIYGATATSSFFWSRLAICSSLLVFHLQLVRISDWHFVGHLHFSQA